MALTTSQLNAIAEQVYRKFPDLKGARPEVQSRARPKSARAGASEAAENYLVTFKGQGQTTDRHTIIRLVRVTADARGNVIKMSTSR